MKRFSTLVILLFAAGAARAADEIKIQGALLKLIDQLDVPAREAGTLTRINVEEGLQVKVGEALAAVDDTEARFAEERAKVELSIATQAAESDVSVRAGTRALVAAEAELRRAEEARLKLRDIVTESEMDRLRLAVDQARLAIEKAQHDLSVARLQRDLKKVEVDFATRAVARRQIAAPFPGVVVQVHKRLGDWVEPGDKLLRLVRLDRLRIEAFLDSAQASAGLEGRPVTLNLDGTFKPAGAFVGKLIFVSPEIDPLNRSVRILAEFENPSYELKPGMRGTLTVAR
jgi:macrolide-specific efflux system membrane fusion protein